METLSLFSHIILVFLLNCFPKFREGWRVKLSRTLYRVICDKQETNDQSACCDSGIPYNQICLGFI